MHWRIGLLGLGLLSALVVGSMADQPLPYPAPEDRDSEYQDSKYRGVGAAESANPLAQVPRPTGMPAIQRGTSEIGPQVAAAGELIGFNGFDGSGSQTITLVHTGKMQIAVYHIDMSGIHLVSSRPIDADFSLSLNVTKPLPSQIRLLGSQVK